jgi:copper oxidase (laccase) domain-containing protein
MDTIDRFSVDDLRVFVSAGARECCFGHFSLDPEMHAKNLARATRVKSRFGEDVVSQIVNPPRQGGIGYNMFEIIRRILNKNGFKDDQIEMDDTCTSCAGLSEVDMPVPGAQGKFFSNLRQTTSESRGGRNAFLVHLN